MKKIFIPIVLLFVALASNAQSEKKEPPPPPPPKKVDEKVVYNVPPIIKVSGKRADEFYERNPSVSEISQQGNIIILKKKDGTTEKYDMKKKGEDKMFTEKYGVLPVPPPPPPPKK